MKINRIARIGLLSLILVAAFSVAGFAQVETDISGSIGAEFTLVQKDGAPGFDLKAVGSSNLDIGIVAGGNGNLRAVVKLVNPEQEIDFANDVFGELRKPQVDEAYIEATGAWLVGRPSVTTRVGRFDVSYNSLIADELGQAGIEIAGVELGSFTVDTYAGWDGTDRPVAFRLSGDVDTAGFDFVGVNRNRIAGAGRVFDLSVAGAINPVDDIILGGLFARDGENAANAYEVYAILETNPNVDFGAFVWSVDEDFAPRYITSDVDELDFEADERGFAVAAWTEHEGVDLAGGYIQTGKLSDANWSERTIWGEASTTVEGFDLYAGIDQSNLNGTVSRTVELGVGRTIGDVNFGYTAILTTGEPLESVIDASTTKSLRYTGNVDLAGQLRLKSGEDVEYSADATWQAPNGFNLGVHYANYSKEAVRGALADGLYMTAGVKVEF